MYKRMHKQSQKRKFLDIYSSGYLRPSKYLMIHEEEENNNENNQQQPRSERRPLYKLNYSENDDEIPPNDNSSNPSICTGTTHDESLNSIGDDCLMVVVEFLDLDDLPSCFCVSKNWAALIIPYFLRLTQAIYENDEHLQRLREYGMATDQNETREGLFTECASWKAALCYEEGRLKEGDELVGNFSDDEDVIEHNDCDFHRTLIPFGSPLCKGTIQEQFELVQDEIDLQSYRQLVEKMLGVKQEEQGRYETNPFVYYDKIQHEKGMIDSYIDEVQESVHVDCGNPIWYGDVPYYADVERFNICQIEYTEFPFYALRSGITRFIRRAGILFYEPSFVEDAMYQMKKFIYLIIKDAYETKFPNKTEDLEFEESDEQYSTFCVDPEEPELCFDDRLDSDKKLSSEDIVNSFAKITGQPFFFAEEDDPYEVKESNFIIESNSHVGDVLPEPTPIEEQNNENGEEESSSEEECFSDEEECNLLEENEDVEPATITDENFIDDESNVFSFDLENLGDTLPELLMKVSIRVHEEVYGNERAHKEKLYLKNWYCNGEHFFTNCSKQLDNPTKPNQEEGENEPLPEGDKFCRTEKQQIDIDMKEDVEYFGYALYEDNFDEFPILTKEDYDDLEQATEEESLQYHLRRMLREQSYECITKYFNL